MKNTAIFLNIDLRLTMGDLYYELIVYDRVYVPTLINVKCYYTSRVRPKANVFCQLVPLYEVLEFSD